MLVFLCAFYCWYMPNVFFGFVLTGQWSFCHVKRDRGWRTFKRPGVDAFLEHLAQYYEIVVYSDQLNMVKFGLFQS